MRPGWPLPRMFFIWVYSSVIGFPGRDLGVVRVETFFHAGAVVPCMRGRVLLEWEWDSRNYAKQV